MKLKRIDISFCPSYYDITANGRWRRYSSTQRISGEIRKEVSIHWQGMHLYVKRVYAAPEVKT